MLSDVVGLVLQEADLDMGGPVLALGLDHGAHRLDGVDDVGADPLADLERERRPPVDPGKAFGILEGAPHRGDVGEPDDLVADSTLIGRLSTSAGVSNTPGTLTAKRPWPVSSEPAATSRLLRDTSVSRSSSCRS